MILVDTSGKKSRSIFLDPPWLWIAVFFLLLLLLLAILFPGSLLAQDLPRVKKGVVRITAQVEGKTRVGAGIIVKLEHDAAYILTASHVIEGDHDPQVTFFPDPHRPFRARVLGLEGGDPRGLAALRVEGKLPPDLYALILDQKTSVSGGEPVALIGFPRVEGTLWTVTTGTISGRKGSALSFSGIADEGNSGGPVLVQGKVVGIVTEVGQKFNYAAPAVTARFALEGWGVRLPEEPSLQAVESEGQGAKEATQGTPREDRPVEKARSLPPLMLNGTYQGTSNSFMYGVVGVQAFYQQSGNSIRGSYANSQGDVGLVAGSVRDNVFAGRVASQVFQGLFCDFTSQSFDGGQTINGDLVCSNGNRGSFSLTRQ